MIRRYAVMNQLATRLSRQELRQKTPSRVELGSPRATGGGVTRDQLRLRGPELFVLQSGSMIIMSFHHLIALSTKLLSSDPA